MNIDVFLGVIQIILIATTPLVFAAIGELVTEKTGVLNLGVEGMMLVGAVTAFVTLVITGSYTFNVKPSSHWFSTNNIWHRFKLHDWKTIYWNTDTRIKPIFFCHTFFYNSFFSWLLFLYN